VPRNRRIPVLRAAALGAVLGGALVLAGCASPPAARAAPPAATAAASGAPAAAPPAAGPAHIMAYSIDSDGPGFRAILTGAVGDYGPAVTVLPDGTVDPQHTSQLELKLVRGTFRIGIARIDKMIISAYRHWPVNSRTCSGTVGFTAPAPVVAGSGTGAYRKISGGFTMTVTIDEIDAGPACDGTSRFLSQVILLAGTGTVSF
jgi:hypothetical protein